MAVGQLSVVIRRLLLAECQAAEHGDTDLLECFVANKDEAAFAALMERHGRLVFGVCRSVLEREQDAEDAYQATFFVLARMAASIRKRDSLASWLHGVALRTALKARQAMSTRRRKEPQALSRTPLQPAAEAASREVEAILHEEVGRLAEKYRTPFVLCCLEGKGRVEAARELKWKEGTVASRVAQARNLLKSRLLRRGVAVPALASAAFAPSIASAASNALTSSVTLHGAMAFAAGTTPPAVSVGAAALAEGVIQAMFITKLKLVSSVVLGALLLIGGCLAAASSYLAPDPIVVVAPPAQAAQNPEKELGERREVQGGHSRFVSAVALSGDGKLAITTSEDNTAILWDSVTAKQLRTFPSSWIHSVGLSADGKRAFTCTEGMTTVLWDTVSGKKLQTFQGHTKPVQCVALSGDGKLALTGSLDLSAILWDATTGKKLHTFQHKGPKGDKVRQVVFSGDGKIACTLTQTEFILWSTITGMKLNKFEVPVISIALSDDGNRALGGLVSERQTALLWDTANGNVLHTLQGVSTDRNNFQACVALSGDGKLAVTGHGSNANIWDAESGKKLRTLKGNSNASFQSLVLSADGKIASNPQGSGALLWNTTTGERIQEFKGRAQITSLAVSGDGKSAILGSSDRSATFWNADGAKNSLTVQSPSWMGGSALSFDGNLAVVADPRDERATFWDTANGKQLHRFPLRQVTSVAVSKNGGFALTGLLTNSAILWDTASGKEVRKLEGHAEFIWSVALNHDAKLALTGSRDMTAIVWDASNGKKLHTLKGHTSEIRRVALSGDGKLALTGSYDKTAILWDATNGKKRHTLHGHTAPLNGVALSSDSKLALTCSEDRTAILWDAASGKRLQTFSGHTDAVNGVAFGSNQKLVWTASADGTTRLWDFNTGMERCRLYTFDAGKDWLIVTPEGHFDGSEGAWRFVAYRESGTLKLADDDATRRRFHQPGLLSRILDGK